MAGPEARHGAAASGRPLDPKVQRPRGMWGKLPAAVSSALGETLMPLLLLLGGCVALLLTSQGAELAVMASEDGRQWIWIALAALAWSLVTWGWARELLTCRFGPREEWTTAKGAFRARLLDALAYPQRPDDTTRARAWALGAAVDWVPRVYAACPWFIAAGFALSGQESWLPFILLAAAGIAVMLLLPFRRNVARKLGRLAESPLVAPKTLWWASLALVLLTACLFFLYPAFYGEAFGTVGSAFLFFAVLLPPLALLGSAARRAALPVISVFLVVFLGPALLDRGRHEVRRAGAEPSNRLDLQRAAAAWTAPFHGAAQPVSAAPQPPSLFVVTTAGGGISAAMWTALLLGTVEDARPGFAERVFAISGVSGGALGAAVFAAAVGPEAAAPTAVQETCKAIAKRTGAAEGRCAAAIGYHALSPDFLGPTVAAYAFADTFAPYVQLFTKRPVPNRAQVLEEAWEQACAQAGCPAMAGGLHTLRDGLPWRPLLFLNGTHVQSGQRMVTSQVRVTPRHFIGALDFVALTGAEVRLSTAALNAARFPYVTPVGLLRDARGAHLGHVADGGYFENYGSETGAEIVQALRKLRPGARLVLVEISSDPSLRSSALERYGGGSAACPADERLDTPLALAEPGPLAKVSAQVVGPPISLYRTRSARGEQGATRAARALDCGSDDQGRPRPRLVQFALCPLDGDDSRPPLGWSLSAATKQRIRADAEALHGAAEIADTCRKRNREAMNALLDLVPRQATTAAHVAATP